MFDIHFDVAKLLKVSAGCPYHQNICRADNLRSLDNYLTLVH
jgi:hypothetical protein